MSGWPPVSCAAVLAEAHAAATTGTLHKRTLCTGLVLLAIAFAAAYPAAANATAAATGDGTLDSTVAYLEGAQNADGGFAVSPGKPSDPGISAWVALALAATGINPQDQHGPAGTSAYEYLTAQAGSLAVVPDFERALLIADAAGTSPHDFGGRDLAGTILAAELPDGSFPFKPGEATPDVNDTSFAVLSLSLLDEPAAQTAVARGAQWLAGAQNADGSWPSTCPRTVPRCDEGGTEPGGEIDATAAAIEALNAAGEVATPAQTRALEWLRRAQTSDGGLPEYSGEPEANVASTAWTAQALWAASVNPSGWETPSGGNPLSFIASLQQADGSVDWRPGQQSEPVWMTAYVAPALAGRQLPIGPVPHAAPVVAPTAAPAVGGNGAPTTAPASAKGVRSGGGGRGAGLFSRPQPQSQGHGRGGARDLGSSEARHHAGPAHASPQEAKHHERPQARSAEREVSGLLLAAHTAKAAPGLATSGAGGEPGSTAALAIGLCALLAAAIGGILERRPPERAP